MVLYTKQPSFGSHLIEQGKRWPLLRFEEGVQEIFAVHVLPARFPEMLKWNDERLKNSNVCGTRRWRTRQWETPHSRRACAGFGVATPCVN